MNKFNKNKINSVQVTDFIENTKNKKRKNIYRKKKINKINKFKNDKNIFQKIANNSLNFKPCESKYISNIYNYEDAIKYDKRSFWRIYYISLLHKQNFLNIFLLKSPLEIQSLIISLFIFNCSCDFALNALFYFNQKISEKYHYKGDYLLLYTLGNNILITIISSSSTILLSLLLNFLTNSKEEIKNIFLEEENKLKMDKNYKVKNDTKRQIYIKLLHIYKILKIKIICYIFLEYSLLLFFFYYIIAFCEVNENTQISWILDSILSVILSILSKIAISFFIALFYTIGIKYKSRLLYKLSIFLY